MKHLILILALGLAACAFNSNNTDDKKDAEDRDRLARTFDSIRGTYKGEIRTPTRTYEARLTLSYDEVQVGKDVDAQPVMRPVLKARLVRPTLLVFDQMFEGKYFEANGDLTLMTPAKVGKDGKVEAPSGDNYNIRGLIRNGHFTAPIKINGDDYAVLDVRFDAADVRTEADENVEQWQRLRARMNQIVGTYDAKAISDNGENFKPLLRFAVIEINGAPNLRAFYRRSDSFLPMQLNLIYRPDIDPQEVSFSNTDPKTGELVSFFGTYSNGHLEGYLESSLYRAKLKADRKSIDEH